VSILTKFFGRTASEGAAFAIGTAVGPTLIPAVRFLENEAWQQAQTMPLRPQDAAQAEAQQVAAGLDKASEAHMSGINAERFAAMVDIHRAYPGLNELLELRRRDLITEAELLTLLNRLGFTDTNAARLANLQTVLLSPADLAMMRQQGFIDVARQHSESALQGVDSERADLLFEISGLPPGIETAMEMWRRGIIDQPTFAQIVREGHTKTKYTADLEALKRALLNPATVVNLYLRGWITQADFHSRMALHGYDAGESDDWYDASGRPATTLQMVKGYRRGGRIPGVADSEHAHVEKAVVQSDIRPEDLDVIFAGRESYPSAFVMRRLVADGAVTTAEAADILYKNAWPRDLADKAAASWAVGTGTTKKGLTVTDLANEYEAAWITRTQYVTGLKELGYDDATAAAKADAEDAKRVRLARNQLVARVHSQYVAHRISLATATNALNSAGVPARVRDSLLPDWTAERDLTADALTAAQIKKAWQKVMMTRAEAISRLEFKGYDAADAALYLDE
jgi:hypothetical protein